MIEIHSSRTVHLLVLKGFVKVEFSLFLQILFFKGTSAYHLPIYS
jgi:hypothetical protein